MKLNQIALAVATIFVAPAAFALTPTQLNTGVVNQLWISGATAPTAAVYGGARKVCVDVVAPIGVPDDLHVYTELAGNQPGSSAAGKLFAYACSMDLDASGIPVKTIVYHTADVGSFEAYTPHLFIAGEVNPSVSASVRRLRNIKIGGGNTCVAGAVNASGDPTFVSCGSATETMTVGEVNAPITSLPTVPQGGFSDTEYILNQLNLGIQRPLTAIGSEASANIGQGFGLAVSWPLYRAMQRREFTEAGHPCVTADSTTIPPNTGEVTFGGTIESCQPNVTRQEYSSLLTPLSNGNKDASIFGAPANTPLQVERRVGTSGTQSVSNVFFLNKPCATGKPGGELTLSGTNLAGTTSLNAGKLLITSNAGSGNVKSRIHAATNTGAMAIGVLSLENPSNNPNEKFLFVQLNEISPDENEPLIPANVGKARQTSVDGEYEFWYELVGFKATPAYPEGVALIDGIVTAWSDPTITDLRGIFPTPNSGATGPTVSKGYKNGNSCSPAVE